MTILICIPCLLIGGTELQTLSLVRALVRRAHRVVAACYFEHNPDIVNRYRSAGSEVELFSPQGERKTGSNCALFLYSKLRECVLKYHPDVAHVQYMAPGALPCLLLRLLGVQRIIATAHTDARIYRSRSLRMLRFICKHVTDVFTCITTRAEEEFFGISSRFTPEHRLARHSHTTLYNALPAHVQLATAPRTELPASPVIGVVGRMEGIKGMELVLPAFALLLKEMPHVRLLVVGDGSLTPLMKSQAAQLGVANSVEWVGRQSPEELSTYYDRLSLLWMPSLSEGFGLSALEAMARACPVVASRVGGLPELVEAGECGELCEPGDVPSLAAVTLRILQDEERWKKLSRGALNQAEQFSNERYEELTAHLYKQVLCMR